MQKLRLAVLLSGSGTTLENLFVQRDAGKLNADIVAVLSSRADAFGLERAKRHGVPALLVEKKKFKDCETFSKAIFQALAPYKPDLICLAGFMSLLKIGPGYQNRVVNVHPALLPAFSGKGFYGHHVHEAVLKDGCKVTGCTVHFVDDQYDHGPIILQKEVGVLPDDTVESLAARVQAAEREAFPQAIQLIADGRLKIIEDRRVEIVPKTS
jgi:phosphoribosylglycinamide formyltransferase 1